MSRNGGGFGSRSESGAASIPRREFLSGLAVLSAAAPALAGTAQRRARVRPGDPGWPTAGAWEALRMAVDGHLLQPQPLLAPCAAEPSGSGCRTRLTSLRNPYFLGDQPSGTQVSGWLDAWRPEPSAYVVVAQDSAHVAAAVRFAARRNLRLVIKGGGHSYQGTSNAPDSLLVWTRAMRDIVMHDGFVPTGCNLPPVPAVTVGAGAMWMDVYDAVTTRAGRYVQGGGCATVGVAGLIQSGGFGSFSKRFGLAAAGLLEAEVVTADGRVRTVNAGRDPELFWALKGGGGGAFGVVTRLTLATHDLPALFGSMSLTVRAGSDAAFERLITRFLAFYREALLNPHWGESLQIRPSNELAVSMVCEGLSEAEIAAAWKPFLDWIAAADDLSLVQAPGFGAREARTWWDAQLRRAQGSSALVFDDRPDAAPTHAWWAGDQEQVSAYLHAYDSIWLAQSLLEADRMGDLAKGLVAASREAPVALHFNKGLAGAPVPVRRRALDTAMNPQVCDAFALAIVAAGGPPPIPELGRTIDVGAARANRGRVEQAMARLRALAPGAGSYVSESDFFNREWRGDFWGSNASRLEAIKARYDPAGLFFVHHGVGSERWTENGFVPI